MTKDNHQMSTETTKMLERKQEFKVANKEWFKEQLQTYLKQHFNNNNKEIGQEEPYRNLIKFY